ncbi:MAG TPA: Gfo/Idh/MocA family oxidoreductase [Ferruginibacter sp.]|nr:Gfo/Idh/MocA family oxidoreductase [Ferruginibacter sp.]
MKNFALIGAGGYVAPRHMQAIKETGNKLIAAFDIHDSVGVLDNYFPETDFFTSFEEFGHYLENQKNGGNKVNYISVCSPNHLHDAHVRFGLKLGADVICEKPVVLNPWDVDALMEAERETGRKVFTILQLRLHPAAKALKEKIAASPAGKRYKVNLEYITARGNWYHTSWKGDTEKSGGIATNIGVHFFDLLLWIFGEVKNSKVSLHNATSAAGELELEKADVNWMLSINAHDLPEALRNKGRQSHRIISVDDEVIDFNDGFTGLHTKNYEEIIAGRGVSIRETRDVIKLVHGICNSK